MAPSPTAVCSGSLEYLISYPYGFLSAKPTNLLLICLPPVTLLRFLHQEGACPFLVCFPHLPPHNCPQPTLLLVILALHRTFPNIQFTLLVLLLIITHHCTIPSMNKRHLELPLLIFPIPCPVLSIIHFLNPNY
ncbi:hypothetical protein Salat_0652200 [Sesamum alatum]|uniref:Uncharacterized protein n=1 Tax=Sesamum alatum TaxID=300844 RepID=A0AAE1YSK2_9LAMI|nr:hypothetical protein Salat_0652200 [Sesamum alatum]